MTIRQFFGRDIKLRHLRLLIAIDDAGQLSRAARVLHVTQPALSKALAEIEGSIGAPLFDRTPRGLIANLSGAALIRAARSALAELERAGGEMENLDRGQTRSLAIGGMPTSALWLLSAAIARLTAREPSLAVSVIEAPTDSLLPQLLAGRLQLVVGARSRRALNDGMDAIPLYDEPMLIVVAPHHPLARRGRIAWEECIAYPWVLAPPANPLRIAFERAVRRAGWVSPPRVVHSLMSDLVLGLLAEAGAVNLMPDRQARALEQRGQVRIVGGSLAATLGLSMPITAFVQPDYGTTPGVRTLLDCLREVAIPVSQPA